jgi:hypothetical protein
MKFMLLYKLHTEKRHDALKGFAQMTPENDKEDMGDKIKLIGRWHDVAHSKGVAIIESDSTEAIYNWALNWNSMLDLEITPVLDDAETRAFGKKKFA